MLDFLSRAGVELPISRPLGWCTREEFRVTVQYLDTMALECPRGDRPGHLPRRFTEPRGALQPMR